MATFLPKWFLISPTLIASGACSFTIWASSVESQYASEDIVELIVPHTFYTHGGQIMIQAKCELTIGCRDQSLKARHSRVTRDM